MSLLIAAAVFATAIGCALIGARVMERADRRAETETPRRPAGARYVDAPGFPPLPARIPGQTAPTEAQIAEWEDDDCLLADDLWCAWYPPGSLGPLPETAPIPGPLADEPGDIEDLLTGTIRHLRAAADRSSH